jgi:hypothetical protein
VLTVVFKYCEHPYWFVVIELRQVAVEYCAGVVVVTGVHTELLKTDGAVDWALLTLVNTGSDGVIVK